MEKSAEPKRLSKVVVDGMVCKLELQRLVETLKDMIPGLQPPQYVEKLKGMIAEFEPDFLCGEPFNELYAFSYTILEQGIIKDIETFFIRRDDPEHREYALYSYNMDTCDYEEKKSPELEAYHLHRMENKSMRNIQAWRRPK